VYSHDLGHVNAVVLNNWTRVVPKS